MGGCKDYYRPITLCAERVSPGTAQIRLENQVTRDEGDGVITFRLGITPKTPYRLGHSVR
jgi:hypothetical protein